MFSLLLFGRDHVCTCKTFKKCDQALPEVKPESQEDLDEHTRRGILGWRSCRGQGGEVN